jgi:hypothetical protein
VLLWKRRTTSWISVFYYLGNVFLWHPEQPRRHLILCIIGTGDGVLEHGNRNGVEGLQNNYVRVFVKANTLQYVVSTFLQPNIIHIYCGIIHTP